MKQIGEIVVVDFPLIVAEGKRGSLPALGSIVKTESGLLGIVASHTIESKIPGRVPIAYWKESEILEKEQPQVFALMKWMFRIILFGISDPGKIEIPALGNSAKIHSLVYLAENETVEEILTDKRFFSFLYDTDANLFPQRNQVVLNLLKSYFGKISDSREKTEKYERIFGNLAQILRNDYPSLKKLLDGVDI